MQLNKIFYEPLKWSLLLAALSGTLLLTGCDRQQQSSLQGHAVPEVSTVTVQPQELMLTTELSGRTSAYRIAEIRPQVSGIIQKRLFKEGSDVKAGQVLYQIDPAHPINSCNMISVFKEFQGICFFHAVFQIFYPYRRSVFKFNFDKSLFIRSHHR